MQVTQLALLQQLGEGNTSAWHEADAIYRPLIAHWLGRFGLQATDLDDLTQDVMLTLAREISHFEHRGRIGAFRSWLRTITVNRAREFYRHGRIRPTAKGGTWHQAMLEDLHDDASPISRQFDRSHDAHIVRRLIEDLSTEFSRKTMTVFQMHVVDGQDAATVAAAADVSRWTVYQVKSRVLRRLRERLGPWASEIDLG